MAELKRKNPSLSSNEEQKGTPKQKTGWRAFDQHQFKNANKRAFRNPVAESKLQRSKTDSK